MLLPGRIFSLAGFFSYSALVRKRPCLRNSMPSAPPWAVHPPCVRSLSGVRLDFLSVHGKLQKVGVKADSLPELQALWVYTPHSLVEMGLPRGAIPDPRQGPSSPSLLGVPACVHQDHLGALWSTRCQVSSLPTPLPSLKLYPLVFHTLPRSFIQEVWGRAQAFTF